MSDGIEPQFTGTDGEVYVVLERPVRGPEIRLVAELVLEAFGRPKPSPKHFPGHLNGDKQDNSLLNLTWGIPA